MALSRPDLEVTLIEPMERRCAWLELVAEELDLDNVRVWRAGPKKCASVSMW